MKPKLYTILYVGAETGDLCDRPVEGMGTLPVSRWAEEHIKPIAAPDQPIHIIEVDPYGGHMIINAPGWMPNSQEIDRVG